MTSFLIPLAAVLFLAGTHGAATRGKSASFAKCEDIDVPFCKGLPYQTTHDANQNGRITLLNVSSVRRQDVDARLGCSKDLGLILCLYHLPVCLPNDAGRGNLVMKPCSGFCRRVQAQCSKKIAAQNLTWLMNVHCSTLPDFKTSACINSSDDSLGPLPSKVVPSVQTKLKLSKCDQRNQTDRDPLLVGDMCNKDGSFKAKQCQVEPWGCYCVDSNGDELDGTRVHNSMPLSCNPCTCAKNRSKLTRQLYMEGKYDFAIRAKILSQRRDTRKTQRRGRVTLFTVKIQSIWRKGRIAIQKNQTVTLRYNATCLCPKMKNKKEYIICGHEDASAGVLQVTQDGTVEDFSGKYVKRLRAWENAKRRMLRGISQKNNSNKRQQPKGN